MSAPAAPPAAPATGARPARRPRDLSQLGVCAFLVLLGALVVADAATLSQGLVDDGVVGPRPVPYVVGAGLVVTALVLAVDVLRGGRGEAEDGEDVDLSAGSDFKRIGLLVLVFAANVLLVERLGWVVSGALFFGGVAKLLGGRSLLRAVAVGAVLSLLTFYFFWVVLGIQLPPGVLDGVL
ncbi:tripartite tricarboxylate transporter TctB family protein [Kineococcus vitellinus]|uniref:tripartite tricarboxylate transporter TctB family protein n=1 Tax=Kineococcus vitellinus TaxID=2696565 RepID=UPI00196AB884